MLTMIGVAALNLGFLTSSPVHVATCELQTPQIISSNPDGGVDQDGEYAMHATFVDVRNQPVKRVVFELNDGTRITDVGTFSPNVTIDHTILLSPNQAESCKVVSATLADGEQWKNQ